ncbi:MAG TPA: tellurite resistance TerB family protein [Verrucomicrobiae bacterium]
MGLFDSLLGGQSAQNSGLSKQEAFLAVMLIAIAADGSISEEEIGEIGVRSKRMQSLKQMSNEQLGSTVRKLVNLAKTNGAPKLLTQAAEALPAELRPTAFAVAADLMLGDGGVQGNEMKALEAMQQTLQVPPDLAVKIIEVLQIKSKG